MIFYTGLHHPNHAVHFEECFISINVIRKRKSDFGARNWIMDSGAFTEVSKFGGYRYDIKEYAEQIKRWHGCGNLECAVSQDYMCEPFILAKTGLNVSEHQKLTIDRYDALLDCDLPVYIMPVLQGYSIYDYLKHIEMYSDRLNDGMRVGVGSVCKRNSSQKIIYNILSEINKNTNSLKLHGFGLKKTALSDYRIRKLLYSADSMAWSFAARMKGGDANSYKEALAFRDDILAICKDPYFFELGTLFNVKQ